VKALRVAVVTRPGSIPGQRNVGYWAYPVPEFTWQHFEVPKGSTRSRAKFSGFDLIVWEDGKSSIRWVDKGPPIAYVVVDSTLDDEHYQARLRHGAQADVILVDWDRLERFEQLGKPVRRFSHCVNDRRFRDWGEAKTVDVAYHLSEDTPERRELGDWLGVLCQERGYVYARGARLGDDYARAFNRAKVTVDLARTPLNRDHRLFDAMGCRTCVLTSPLPEVSGEVRAADVDYLEWADTWELRGRLEDMLDPHRWGIAGPDRWHWIADQGLRRVQDCHTWAARARELRETLRGLGIG
jgi:hypothetical protein